LVEGMAEKEKRERERETVEKEEKQGRWLDFF